MKKKQITRILSLLLTILMLCSLAGCKKSNYSDETDSTIQEQNSETDSQPNKKPEDVDRTTAEALAEQEKFAEFSDRVFKKIISENTLNLHCTLAHPENYGIDEYEISFGTFDKEEEEKSYEEMEEYLKEVKTMKYELLTDEQQLTYDIFVGDLLLTLEGKEYRLYGNVMSPGMGIQSYIPIILAEYAFYDEQDIQDYLKLLKEIEPYFKEMMQFEKEQSEAGFFMPDYAVDKVIDECEQFVSEKENHYMMESFNERIEKVDFIDDKAKENYKKQNKEILKKVVLPAYEYVIDELKKLKGTCKNQGGLAGYENGKKYYELLVHSYTGSDKSVEEILQKIKNQFQADSRRVLTISLLNPNVFEEMFDYPGDLSDPKKTLEELQEKIKEDFPEGPQVQYTVNYVPKSMEEHTNPAYYITAPRDDMNNNPIYINRSMSSGEISDFSTLAHEGFPGHLYQTTYFNAQETSLLRELISFDGYSEGWGTYAELYSYSLAGLSDTIQELNVINTTYSFGIYCQVDIGVNYEGWSREEAMSFLAEQGITGETADTVYETMVEQPAVYLCYYLGYLEFMDLREEAQDKLGDKFSMKAFHEFILKTGPAQFAIIRDRMEDWIAEQ